MWKIRVGLLSGRQMRSPAPFQIASPSESCTSGRQSAIFSRPYSAYQNIEVSGATPMRSMSCRRNKWFSMSITTPPVRKIRNL